PELRGKLLAAWARSDDEHSAGRQLTGRAVAARVELEEAARRSRSTAGTNGLSAKPVARATLRACHRPASVPTPEPPRASSTSRTETPSRTGAEKEHP